MRQNCFILTKIETKLNKKKHGNGLNKINDYRD